MYIVSFSTYIFGVNHGIFLANGGRGILVTSLIMITQVKSRIHVQTLPHSPLLAQASTFLLSMRVDYSALICGGQLPTPSVRSTRLRRTGLIM